MPSVALVLNPVARGAAAARRAVEAACTQAGLGMPSVLPTTIAEPGGAQAREALARGCRRVVVAGGDGTVRQVVGEVAAVAGQEVVVGVVPCGTANLAARTLGLPTGRADAAARLAVRAEGHPIDVGSLTLEPLDGPTSTLPFLVVVGAGHDAQILAALSPTAKARWGWPAYVTPGLRRLGHAGSDLQITLDDGDPEELRAWSVLAVNAARLPLGAQVAPGARLDDGRLHVVLVQPRRVSDWGAIAAGGFGARRPHPALVRRVGRHLRVELPGPGPVQVDGDVVPDILRLWIELRPAAVRVAGARGSSGRR